jgi:aminoglycoside phosphotransferase (APT) family kinase protein
MAQAGAQDDPDVAPIREAERFDEAKLESYLKAHVPGLEGPMEALQFPHGHANLTYLVRFGERELVVRRPPYGPVAPKSHDMAREYKVLSRLADHLSTAPHAYHLCEDPEVLGAIFVVMERRRGLIVRGAVPPEVDRVPDGRRRISFALIDAMADLHDVDFAVIGLSDLGRPEGFVERQVHGWKGRWDRAKNAELPSFEDMYGWLVENLPAQGRASLVHNDLKFDNVMIDPDDLSRVAAILDWDMTTLGDPLIDVGTLLGYWVEAGDPPERGATIAVTAQPGFPTRREIAERYAGRRGVPLPSLGWYEAFAMWKSAVVLQQIYIRYVRGQTKDERFAAMGDRVPLLVKLASQVAERS